MSTSGHKSLLCLKNTHMFQLSTVSRFYTYLHDQENRVGRFLEKRRQNQLQQPFILQQLSAPNTHMTKQPLEKTQSTQTTCGCHL